MQASSGRHANRADVLADERDDIGTSLARLDEHRLHDRETVFRTLVVGQARRIARDRGQRSAGAGELEAGRSTEACATHCHSPQ
jgi:hypothetical protein